MYLGKDITQISDGGRFLYVDLRPRLDVYLRYACWDEGLTIYRWKDVGWRVEPFDPGISLITPEHYEDPGLPVYRFIQKIPSEVRELVLPFGLLQTKLIQMCARSWEVRQLLSDFPILSWVIANYLQGREFTPEQLSRLLKKKRKQILAEIYSKGSNADVRMLRKIRFRKQPLTAISLMAIKDAIKNDYAHKFRHLKFIPLQLLIILGCHPFLWESNMLPMLANKIYPDQTEMMREIKRIGQLWEDTIALGEALNTEVIRHLNKCGSVESLKKIHDQWTRDLNQLTVSLHDSQVLFPEAPIKGNKAITQIMNLADLRQEGREMHHCVGGYAKKILERKSFIFKVLQPERATLELKIVGRDIQIGQLRGKYNKRPSDEAFKVVQDWIEEYLNAPYCSKIGSNCKIKVFPRFKRERRNFFDDHLDVSPYFKGPA